MTQTMLCFDARPTKTGREAHDRITRSGVKAAQLASVEALVKQYPGRTSRDLAALTDGLDCYQIARRLDDLRKAKRVRQGDPVVSRTGYHGVTWWPE